MASTLQAILIGGAVISGVLSAIAGDYVQAIMAGLFIWLVLRFFPTVFGQ